MSRAFVRESEQPEPMPERAVSPHPNFVTAAGLRQIEEHVRSLEAARDASREDAEEQARIARDLRYWSQRRATARLIEPPAHPDVVRFGVAVTLRFPDGREQTFRLVGEDEADPAHGLLSWVSPLATAMIGRREGDAIEAFGERAEIERLAS